MGRTFLSEALGEVMNRTRELIVVPLVIVLIFGLAVLRHYHLRAEEARARVQAQQAKRDAEYSKILLGYERKPPLGTTRLQVKSYLEAQKLSYSPSESDYSYALLIGREPGDGFVCDRWNVYIVFDFNTAAVVVGESEKDTLREIKLQKVGHCS